VRRLALFVALLASSQVAVAADPIVVASGDDTAVYRFLPDLARGTYTTLYAFTLEDAGQPHDFRTFVRFDPLPNLAGACVESATAYVYYAFDSSGFGTGENVPGTLTCEPILEPWSGATATWNNQPSTGEPTGTVTGITSFGYLACDVTPTAQAWADGSPNYGVALSSPTSRAMGFYSFEAQVDPFIRPALAITLADDPQACPESAWAAAVAIVALLSWKQRHS
jgi:hypothetical protein